MMKDIKFYPWNHYSINTKTIFVLTIQIEQVAIYQIH